MATKVEELSDDELRPEWERINQRIREIQDKRDDLEHELRSLQLRALSVGREIACRPSLSQPKEK